MVLETRKWRLIGHSALLVILGWLILGGAALLLLFLGWENQRLARGTEPLVNPAILRNRTLQGGLGAFFLQYLLQIMFCYKSIHSLFKRLTVWMPYASILDKRLNPRSKRFVVFTLDLITLALAMQYCTAFSRCL